MENRNDFINSWYGRYKPTFKNFLDFGVRSTEFCRYIANVNHIGIDAKVSTAYYNTKDGKIYHPAIWYSQKYYNKVLHLEPEDAIYAAISFHNGAQIHESLHVKLTPRDFVDKLKTYVENNLEKGETVNWELMHMCMNIIEDVYIETYGIENYEHIFTFNRFVNDILFADDRMESLINTFENDALPEAKNEALVNLLICWKRVENRDNTIYKDVEIKPYINVLFKVNNSDLSIYDRFAIVLELYQLLFKNGVSTPQETADMSSITKEEIEGFIENNKKLLGEIVKEFEDIFYDKKPNEIIHIDDNFTNLEKSLKFVFKLKDHGELITPNSKYNNFSRYIQYLRTKKPSYHLAKDEGNTILDRELYRIGIDANVLTTNETIKVAKGKPQFVILVDSSGSMHHMYKSVLKSAMGIYLSLMSNDIPVSMFGHTGDDYPIIYGISAYKMPFRNQIPETTTNPIKAISNALSIDLSQNYDSFALQSMGNKFNPDRSKYLFILSDGQPNGNHYGGKSAREHIQKICTQFRKKGINVFSISLTEEVSTRNDEIYGKQYNIYGYKNLDKEMQKLVLNFV